MVSVAEPASDADADVEVASDIECVAADDDDLLVTARWWHTSVALIAAADAAAAVADVVVGSDRHVDDDADCQRHDNLF